MAKKRHTEADLRKAKDSATSAVVEQQKKLGVPIAGGKVVEQFVEPIIAKMAREEAREKPAPAPRERDPEVHSEYVGTYEWNLKNDSWKAVDPDSYIPNDVDRMHRIVQQLMKLPVWKAELLKARSVCDKHYFGGPKTECQLCIRREYAIKDVLLRAYKQFGNPWRGREKKITLS